MSEVLKRFVDLRPRLSNVRETDGWLHAEVQLAQGDSALRACLATLQDDGVLSEVRRQGRLVFPPELEPGSLVLKIDTGALPGYFETYDGLIEKHPDESPATYFVWEKV